MEKPVDIPGIRIITISGRIASGSTTLAKKLAETLGWKNIEGGEIFWEAVRSKLCLDSKDTNKRPDIEDEDFDKSLKDILRNKKHIILETKLAGFNAQEIEGVFKILIICSNEEGVDQTAIRIDRLVNREKINIDTAKEETIEREKNDINKWIRLYGEGDKDWKYWDEKYYDLVINTYIHNQDETLKLALEAISYK
jgi:cytidylate kinase